MNISGEILLNKVRKLCPDNSNSITVEELNKICNVSYVQPFLQWFCEKVNYANVLSDNEIRLKDELIKSGDWLEGSELDNALEEMTKDCPALLKAASFDHADVDNLFVELETMKVSYKEDEEYIETLTNGIQNLRKLEHKLDEDIEKAKALLEMGNITMNKTYYNCRTVLKESDEGNDKLLRSTEHLLNIYAHAAKNEGNPILWTQMPLEIFIKQIDLYNHSMDILVKQQFEDISNKNEQETDSDYGSFINYSKRKFLDEKKQKLMSLKTVFTNSKFKEIMAKAERNSCIAMLECVKNVYNNGNLKVPRSCELRKEILELTKKRDILEEDAKLLRQHQLPEIVQQFAELEITKILKHDQKASLEKNKNNLRKLKNLRLLAREHGHVHADLLCILMEMQCQCLENVAKFVIDVRHYLRTLYSCSSTRCESMKQYQNEYSQKFLLETKIHNSFEKCLVSILHGDSNSDSVRVALDEYNKVITQNKEQKQIILEKYLCSKICMLQDLENSVIEHYLNEIKKDPTYNFKPICYEISTDHDNVYSNLQKVQKDLTAVRNKMKEQMKVNDDSNRKEDIIWQRFLVRPNTLKELYHTMKETATKSNFNTAFETK